MLKVEVLSPENTIFTGEAVGVKVPGAKGSFEVLTNHAPVISTLTKGTVSIRQADGKVENIDIKGGIIEVLNNNVIVLA